MKWDPIETTRGVRRLLRRRRDRRLRRRARHAGQGTRAHLARAVPSGSRPVGGRSPRRDRAITSAAVAEHFRGRVLAWDVVNEAIADNGRAARPVFRQKLGDGYIADAFRLARAGRSAGAALLQRLRRRRAGRESPTRSTSSCAACARRACRSTASACRCTSAPTAPPPRRQLAANMRRLAALGLRVNISEMDVRIARPRRHDAGPARRAEVRLSLDRRGAASPSRHASGDVLGIHRRALLDQLRSTARRAAALRRAVRAPSRPSTACSTRCRADSAMPSASTPQLPTPQFPIDFQRPTPKTPKCPRLQNSPKRP